MNKVYTAASVLLAGLLATGTAFAKEDHNKLHADHHQAHWSYIGKTAPEHWGSLAPEYFACGTGKNQSPINLTAMIEGEVPPLSLQYTRGGQEVVNNGHSIQVNYAPGSTLTIAGQTYELKQFHFHSPSENTIDGKSFPLEGHFVNVDKDGNIAVVAVMYELGAANAELEKVWAKMPATIDEKAALEPVNANALLPQTHDYYYFNGSLTTPPCTEGVRWVVMKTYGTVSQDQVDRFTTIMQHPNNRPVQPVNARMIIK